MAGMILGLDIGGANLKAATPDKRAASVPFALWKQPDGLPAALAELVARFPDADELAVTMTGELCDCYETKRQGVNAILDAVESAAAGRPVRAWGTGGEFLDLPTARRNYLTVAAANWHALATFVGRHFAPDGGALLIDIGSTTSDLIPLRHGRPAAVGRTDAERLRTGELIYAGVRRTPVCGVLNERVAAELFATTQDVYIVLGELAESPDDRDTADGRPATRPYSLARLARMLGADAETATEGEIECFARKVDSRLSERLNNTFEPVYVADATADDPPPFAEAIVFSGVGEFLARRVVGPPRPGVRHVSLNDKLGPVVSACAPAYAASVLGAESRP